MLKLRTLLREWGKNLNLIIKHPYFGFVVFGALLLVVLLLRMGGLVQIGVVNAVVLTMIYSIIALGFSLLLGFGGLASLGTAGLVGLGTFVMGYFSGILNWPLLPTLALAFGIAIVVGLIVGFISLRIEGMYLAIITLGLAEILRAFFISYDKFTGGFSGRSFRNFTIFNQPVSTEAVYVTITVVFVLAMIATINIIKSPTGRALLAMKNSDSAAQSLGISLMKYRLLAFIISTVFAVLGGILYIMYIKFSYAPQWNLAFSLEILAAVIVGGAQSIFGIILGVFLIYGLNLAVLNNIPFFVQNPALIVIFNGALIVLVVMFYPGGLIRLIQTSHFKLKLFLQKLKHRMKVRRYGEDD